MRPSLAVVVSMPGREQVLRRALESLHPQVDTLALFWNGSWESCPAFAKAIIDRGTIAYDDTNTRGSGAKLHWSRTWDGLYLACDDDLAYPPDYVATMRSWVERWDRQALVTCHGRVLRPHAERFKDAEFTAHALREVPEGRWLNYPGGCALAFDTSLNVPPDMPGKNVEEGCLAVWAQTHQVPIWLVPHAADWLEYLLPLHGAHYTIWTDELAHGFRNRNSVLAPQGRGAGWAVHEPVAAACV